MMLDSRVFSSFVIFLVVISVACCKSSSETKYQGESIYLFGPFRAELNSPPNKEVGSADTNPILNNDHASNKSKVHDRVFESRSTRIKVDCSRDKTSVSINFRQPFDGVISLGPLDTSACKKIGDGSKDYLIEVAHNETRFHSALETGNDIAKNIMCQLTVGDLVVGRRPGTKPRKVPKLKQQPKDQIDSSSAEAQPEEDSEVIINDSGMANASV